MKGVIIILLLTYTGTYALGQTANSLKGKVTDNGNPMEYFYVTLSMPGDTTVLTAGAFMNGDFEFLNLQRSSYDIMFYCIGYKTEKRTVTIIDNRLDMGEIVMIKNPIVLDEVVVIAARPLFQQRGGLFIVNIAGTILSETGSLIDVLRRSPGLIVDSDNTVNVFGKGTPIIYIDNKEIMSLSELETLSASDIDKIVIDRNPSSQYSASGHAVIRIKTKRSVINQLSLSLFNNFYVSRCLSNVTGIQLNHKNPKWANLLSYSYTNDNHRDYNKSYEENTLPDYVINNTGNIAHKYSTYNHSIFSGNDYNINNRHRLGIQFSGLWKNGVDNNVNDQTIRKTSGTEIYRKINQDKITTRDLYNTNINYQFNPDSTNNTLSVILGYAYVKSNSDNHIEETEQTDNIVSRSRIASHNDYRVYSIKADYCLNLSDIANVKLGAKYSEVVNNGSSRLSNLESDNTRYYQKSLINDKITASYLQLDKTLGDFLLSGGLRYEYTSSKTKVDGMVVDTAYHRFFPSFMADYKVTEHLHLNVTYSKRIRRPSFEQINPNIIYFDSLSYGIGNPFLRPVYSNNMEVKVSIYDLNMIAGYTHKKDDIVNTAENDPANPDITRWTYLNIKNIHSYTLGLTYVNTWRFYTGSFEVYWQKPFVKIPYLDMEIVRDKPIWCFSISNTFNISNNLTINCDFSYQSAGEDGITYWASTYNLSAGLLWRLLKNKLHLSLTVNDILRTVNSNSWEDRYGNIITGMKSNQDYRYIRFGLRYNFNNIKSNIRKRSSNEDELDRM